MVHSSDRLFPQPRHSGLGHVRHNLYRSQRLCPPESRAEDVQLSTRSYIPAPWLGLLQAQHQVFAAKGGSVVVPLQWLLHPDGMAPLYTQGWLCPFLSGLYFLSCRSALVMLPKGSESVSLYQLPRGTVGTRLWERQGCLLGTLEG